MTDGKYAVLMEVSPNDWFLYPAYLLGGIIAILLVWHIIKSILKSLDK